MSFLNKSVYKLLPLVAFFAPASAFAETVVESSGGFISTKAAIGFAIGLAVVAGTMSQSKVVSSALEGISRNPGASGQMQTPLILGLAFIESLVLFAWLMMFLLK